MRNNYKLDMERYNAGFAVTLAGAKLNKENLHVYDISELYGRISGELEMKIVSWLEGKESPIKKNK